jgi:hypothetical protein
MKGVGSATLIYDATSAHEEYDRNALITREGTNATRAFVADITRVRAPHKWTNYSKITQRPRAYTSSYPRGFLPPRVISRSRIPGALSNNTQPMGVETLKRPI